MSLAKIQTYLYEHLDDQKRILHYNGRYIFFRWGDPNGSTAVVGSMGEELIAGRSAAFDNKCFPVGIPSFLETTMPLFRDDEIIKWRPLRRFVINQDSGSAIKGPGRVDLFWGLGSEAEKAAGIMKQPGNVYFLVKK
jgi:membrane-bound lytic murein transglycosylase A